MQTALRACFPAAALLALLPASLRAASAEDFFTQRGEDPTFEEVMDSGDIPRGENSVRGFKGSTVSINHNLLEASPDADREIPNDIYIHTIGHSLIKRGDFRNWSRWYQEDGNTQIFRLFKDEVNVRNDRDLAARVEAFSILGWKKGDWHEWVGTYTIIKPISTVIFQAKNNQNDWSVQLNMGSNGDVRINHRVGRDELIATNMTGKPFHIRVRDNGHDYEVFLNGKAVGKGEYARPAGETNFRWGMYMGGKAVANDGMLLVTGAGIDVKGYDPEEARALDGGKGKEPAVVRKPPVKETKPTKPAGKADETEASEPLVIPERDWTNTDGQVIRAFGEYHPGSDHVKLRVNGKWIQYPLKNLSAADRKAVTLAADISG